MEQEQRGDGIAGAVDLKRKKGRAEEVEASRLGDQHVEAVRRGFGGAQAGQQHDAGSARMQHGGEAEDRLLGPFKVGAGLRR